MELQWEDISDRDKYDLEDHWEADYRARVIGGWLVRHEVCWANNEDIEEWSNRENTIVFIPDPKHEWDSNPMDGAI